MSTHALQIVAIVFVGVLVVFFMLLVLIGKKLDVEAFTIVRFLAAICAGFAGGLFLGSITVAASIAERLTVSAVGGSACFALIWLTFGTNALAGQWYNFAIPEGWTFKQTAQAMVEQEGGDVQFSAFSPEEMAAVLKPGVVKSRGLHQALRKLPQRASPEVRPIRVDHKAPADYSLIPVATGAMQPSTQSKT